MMHSHHPSGGGSVDGNDASILQHRYHALQGDGDDDHDTPSSRRPPPQHLTNRQHHEDDDVGSLWDQLNDEQSREVQQHESRFQTTPYSSRSHPFNILFSMASQTAENVQQTWQTTLSSAQQAWRDQHSRQRQLLPYDYSHPYESTPTSTPSSQRRRQRGRPTRPLPPDELDMQFRISEDLRSVLEEQDNDSNNNGNTERDQFLSATSINAAMDRNDSETATNPAISRQTSALNNNQQSQENVRPLKGYPFVVLQNFSRQTVLSERDTWGIPSNVDVFLTNLYQYFYHRGIVPMTCQFFLELVSLLFTLWLSRILLAFVDWPVLVTCTEEATCKAHWSDYYRQSTHHELSWPAYLLIQSYTIVILSYATFRCWSFWHSLMHASKSRHILHDKLGLSERKLQGGAVAWVDVVQALARSQASGSYRVVLDNFSNNRNDDDDAHNDNNIGTTHTRNGSSTPPPNGRSLLNGVNSVSQTALDPLSVAQRIMRKDNFLIAFFNQGLLDITVGGRKYWCSSLEWSVYNCILNFMFNHKYELRPAFCLDAASLERRLQVCGVVHLLLLPFTIMFVSLHFLLRHVYDARSTRQYMGNNQWSHVAMWTFREFNELPHLLEQRLEPSYAAGTKYIGLFGTSEWAATFGKLLVFLGGAVGGVLLVLGVLNDAILLHVQLWGRNLLWYTGMAGIVYSVGNALLPTKEATPNVTRNLFDDMDVALKNVAQYTHYYPEHWKGRGWDANVYKSFKKLFDTKVKLFVYELAGLILAPYILFFKLSKCAPAICEFCLISKARMMAGSGDVCGFSTFDFDTFGDEAWEGRTLGKSVLLQNERDRRNATGESLTESILRMGNLEDATQLYPKPRAREGKMEKSFFSFQAAHPDMKCSPSGQSLVDRVEEYRRAAMTRERDLHIEAAARQLDTLARLERKMAASRNNQEYFESRHLIQESHHHEQEMEDALTVPPADAGAGIIHRTPSRGGSSSSHQLSISPLYQTYLPARYELSRKVDHSSASNEHWDGRQTDSSGGFPQSPSSSTENSDAASRLESNTHNNAMVTDTGISESKAALCMSSEMSRLFLSSSALLDEAMNSSEMQTHNFTGERSAERQYYWLDRFHEHLEQQQQSQSSTNSAAGEEPVIARSMPIPSTFPNNTGSSRISRPPTRGTSQDATSAVSMV